MKKSIIIVAALAMIAGAVAQTRKKAGKKVDPVVAVYEKQMAEFKAANAELYGKVEEVSKSYYAAKQGQERDSIQNVAMPYYEKLEVAQNAYVKANPSTVLSASFISMKASHMSVEELREAYAKLSDDARMSVHGKMIFTQLTALENTQPGKPAPMIAKNDIDGKSFSLADLKGNVVILDFWASWCVPCRASNPHMMRIYDKYHDKGLKMVYVGDNDSSPDVLRKAIEKDGIARPDIHHLLRGLKVLRDKKGQLSGFDRSNDITDLYGVHEIPTKFLIGKDGNIIGKVESDKWLDEQLSQIFRGEPNRDFHLEGKIDIPNGEEVSLIYSAPDEKSKKVACRVEKGKFHFDGTLANVVSMAYIVYQKDKANMRSQKYCQIYLEPSESKVTIDVNDFSNPKMEGSDTQAEYEAFNKTIEADMAKIKELNEKYENAENADERQAIHDEAGSYSENIHKAQLEYAKAHPQSYLAPEFVFWSMDRLKYDEFKALVDRIPDNVMACERGMMIKEELAKRALVVPGTPAYVINRKDVMTGKTVDMSKMRGKYVIVDFWASWCVPCRKSNPHMIDLYKRYHKKGVEFIFVGDNDSRPQDLKDAIVKDGLQKMHHVLRGLKMVNRSKHEYDRSNDISEKYCVHSIPTKYLIDKEGNIVDKFESDQLEAKLKEIFGE